jgi:hypothetical protein
MDAVLVHPRPTVVTISGAFHHSEVRPVQESYSEQIPYTASESYSCGSYPRTQTCFRTVTRYRSETRYRTVMREVRVGDGECSTQLAFSPQVGRVYLLDFTYRSPGVCAVACYEQVSTDQPGEFHNQACAF